MEHAGLNTKRMGVCFPKSHHIDSISFAFWSQGPHGGAVVRTVASQQEGCGFVSNLQPFCVEFCSQFSYLELEWDEAWKVE